MVNDEMDWLEIRLHTLASSVDYFVILESPVTFTGKEKRLVLKENWDRFKEFHDKIIYHLLENPPIGAPRTWDYEDYQRNAMFLQTFPNMKGRQEATLGDIILVSDVDEIPRPATILLLRNCNVPRRVTIRSRFYYYGFQHLHVGEEWGHPQATLFGGLQKGETILPADLRNGEGGNRLRAWWDKADLWNAGWHCSTCFETLEQVLTKMASFSHTSMNQDAFRDETRIVDRVRKGKDIWDREGENFRRIDGNEDIPEHLKANRTRWEYLLNRDGINAGFKDYVEGYIPGE
jgi:beta-1,4-mannosyl-glycoprotein beta-1,4-N-acetylglucosaminyltransferase